MRSSGRSGGRWWTRWPIHVYQLTPSVSRGFLGIVLFALYALLFIAVANPFSLLRIALGVLAVIVVNGLLVVVADRLHHSYSHS